MVAKHLAEVVVHEHDPAIYAAYRIQRHEIKAVVVVNAEEAFIGTISNRQVQRGLLSMEETAGEICNRGCKRVIVESEGYDTEKALAQARTLLADNGIKTFIPVVSRDGDLLDIITVQRAFYRYYYEQLKLPRMHYARCIWDAAGDAKRLGYKSFSVIEFGVAGGNGLVNCEFHAREISRLTGVDIEVYGFDTGTGMPKENSGYKDLLFRWPAGAYEMDIERLQNRLTMATLVLGDTRETTRQFFSQYDPAPVGVMLIDVDYYSSTVPILQMLEAEHSHFIPRVRMYFDDVNPSYQFQGENLAIREFNERHEDIKISPEGMRFWRGRTMSPDAL